MANHDDRSEKGSDKQDLAEYHSLCDADSPDFIGDLAEYTGFFTYSMCVGHLSKTR